MILAGDIGGTKTVLSLLSSDSKGVITVEQEQTFQSGDYQQFDDLLAHFLPPNTPISSACFGIAGPVVEQRSQLTNLPWVLDAIELKQSLGTQKVKLLNDLEAMAIGMLHLADSDLVELNPNAKPQCGNIAVIAAGTGLGEAILYWNGLQHLPIATEGGHCDFAAQTIQQDMLLNFLRKKYNGHVSYERIISGIGFSNLYDFLLDYNYAPPCPAVPADNTGIPSDPDRNAVISRLGINGEDPLCSEAVRLFVELYGAEAGNLALKSFATGGIYIGGGISPKIRPVLENGNFLKAFKAKGRFHSFLDKIPVKLSLNQRTPLIGAINYFDRH